MMILPFLFACMQVPEFVNLDGVVYSGMEGTEGLDGVDVQILDAFEDVVGSDTTAAGGAFSAQARTGQRFYMVLEGEGHAKTSLTGSAGLYDSALEDGAIWMRSDEELAQLEADFAGCPGAGEGGTVIDGEVRIYVYGYDREELPRVETAWALAFDADGNEYEACYLLNDETVVEYDPEATETGYHGRYAIFGAPAGPLTLEVGYTLVDQPYYAAWYYIYAAEDSNVPVWPSYVEI